jgi:hypothetical protein
MPVCAHEIIFAKGIWYFKFAIWFEQRIRAAAPSLRPIYYNKIENNRNDLITKDTWCIAGCYCSS